MLRRIDVKPDDIEQFGGKSRIVGQLELAELMRLETMLAPDALHRTDADANVAGHGDRGPMRGFTGCGGLRGRDNAGLDFSAERWDARRAGLVAQQAGNAFGHEPLLPTPDRGLALAGATDEFHRAAALRGQQHDLRP